MSQQDEFVKTNPRYKQIFESEVEKIDGYDFTYRADEFLGPSGRGYTMIFRIVKDGKAWELVDSDGEAGKKGLDGGWSGPCDANPMTV